MKRYRGKAPKPAGQAVFHKVAENLYRLESSGGYYSLVKRAGKQFRRSLETKDRKLAERRLGELRAKIGALRISDDAGLNSEEVGKSWTVATNHDFRHHFAITCIEEGVAESARAAATLANDPVRSLPNSGARKTDLAR